MSDSTLTGNAPVRQKYHAEKRYYWSVIAAVRVDRAVVPRSTEAAGLVCWDLRRWWR